MDYFHKSVRLLCIKHYTKTIMMLNTIYFSYSWKEREDIFFLHCTDIFSELSVEPVIFQGWMLEFN